MNKKQKEFALLNAKMKTPEQISRELGVSLRKVKRFLESRNVPNIPHLENVSSQISSISRIEAIVKGKFSSLVLPSLLLAGLALRAIYLFQLQSNPLIFQVTEWEAFDQYRFMRLANEFYKQGWLGSQVSFFSPAYSYIIAFLFKFFSPQLNVVFGFQMLLGSLGILVIYCTGRLLFKDRWAALFSSFFLAFYSPIIFTDGDISRDSPILYFNLFSFYFFLKAMKKNRTIYFFVGSLFLALSFAIRPHPLPLFVVATLLFLMKTDWKTNLLKLLVMALPFALVVSPIALRNNLLGKNVLLESQGLELGTFWIGNTFDSEGIGFPQTPYRKIFAEESHGTLGGTLRILAREIKQHPKEYLALYLRKVRYFFNSYEIPSNLSFDLFKKCHPALRGAFIDFMVVSPLALLGLFLSLKKRDAGFLLLHLYFIVLSVSVILLHIQSRYRTPAVPFFIIYASFALSWLLYKVASKDVVKLVPAALLLIVLVFLVKPDEKEIKKYFGGTIRAIDFTNLAYAYLEKTPSSADNQPKRDFEKACYFFEEGYKVGYADPSAPLALAETYVRLGNYKRSKEILNQILGFDSNNENAKQLLKKIGELA